MVLSVVSLYVLDKNFILVLVVSFVFGLINLLCVSLWILFGDKF